MARATRRSAGAIRIGPRRPTIAGTVSEDANWERIDAFLAAVVPVAEAAKVRLACHPHDPYTPPGYRGVTRVLGTVAGMQRFVTMHESPYHGLNFCQGTVAEMLDDPRREIDDVIRWFGTRGKLFNVHFRNIKGRKLDFMEAFPDEGDMDMARSLRVYQEVGYQYMLMPDHVPEIDGRDPSGTAFAFCYGYIRGLLDLIRRTCACRPDRPGTGGTSVDSLDDAHVTLRGIAECDERRLVTWAVVRGDRLRDAGELDQHGALVDAGLIGLCGAAAGEEAAAAGDDGGAGKLGVLGQRRRGWRSSGSRRSSMPWPCVPLLVMTYQRVYPVRRTTASHAVLAPRAIALKGVMPAKSLPSCESGGGRQGQMTLYGGPWVPAAFARTGFSGHDTKAKRQCPPYAIVPLLRRCGEYAIANHSQSVKTTLCVPHLSLWYSCSPGRPPLPIPPPHR